MVHVPNWEAHMSSSEYLLALVAAGAMWTALLGGFAIAPEGRSSTLATGWRNTVAAHSAREPARTPARVAAVPARYTGPELNLGYDRE